RRRQIRDRVAFVGREILGRAAHRDISPAAMEPGQIDALVNVLAIVPLVEIALVASFHLAEHDQHALAVKRHRRPPSYGFPRSQFRLRPRALGPSYLKTASRRRTAFGCCCVDVTSCPWPEGSWRGRLHGRWLSPGRISRSGWSCRSR